MNHNRYEKVKRLAEESPQEGERSAAREAMRRMETRRPPAEHWKIVWTLNMVCMRPSGIPRVTTC